MKLETLKKFIINGDHEGLCKALAKLDEGQRTGLADDALKLYKIVSEHAFQANHDFDMATLDDPELIEIVGAMNSQDHADWRIPRLTAGLALMGLCDDKALKGHIDSWFTGDMCGMPHRVLQILNDRRPPWLAKWLAKDAVQEFPTVTWFVERGLIRSGALPANESDAYIQRMADHLGQYTGKIGRHDIPADDPLDSGFCGPSIEAALRADPELLEREFWRLFEIDTRAFAYDWGWRDAVLDLCEKGDLDRQRVLAACLEGMTRPLRKQTLSSFIKLHDELGPDPSEREQLVDKYLALLDNDVPQVVGCGMKALENLAKEKKLDGEAFLNASPAVFRLANKAQPRKAIKLAKKLLKADKSLAPVAAAAVATGVGNEFPDVQEDAIALLESLEEHIDDAVREELQGWSDNVAAALRPRFETLAGASRVAETDSAVGADDGDWQARFDAIDPSTRAAAGVDAARASLEEQSDPYPAALDPRVVPRRDPTAAVAPLASLDELIDTVAALVERVDDVMDVERVLDGIGRFHAERPADFEKRVKPLRKRIEARSEPYSYTPMDLGVNVGLAQLIRRWLEMPEVHRDWGTWRDLNGAVFRNRCQEVAWRMDSPSRSGDRNTAAMLSLPTHQDGWIDPVVFVERLSGFELSQGNYLVHNFDFAQALLRLTPDGRDEALERLPKKGHRNTHQLVQYVLGDDVELWPIGGYGDSELVIAAVHARSSVADVADADLPFTRPVAALDKNGERRFVGPVADDPAIPGSLLSAAHAMLGIPDPWGPPPSESDWLSEWMNLTWPGNRGPICLYASITSESSVYLKNLLERDTTWGEEACRLAAWATGAHQAVAKGLITDALIDAIGGALVDPRRLGRHLAAILPHLKLNRVAAVLDETSRISPLHQWSVFKMLDSALADATEAPRDLHHLLTVLLECATVTGNLPGDKASALLKGIKGASKTAKLAKQVLALPAADQHMQAVRRAALNACLDRADRWLAPRVSEHLPSGKALAAGPSVVASPSPIHHQQPNPSGKALAAGPSVRHPVVVAAAGPSVVGPFVAAGPSVVGPSVVTGPFVVAGPSPLPESD